MNAPTPRSMLIALLWFLLAVAVVQLAVRRVCYRRPGSIHSVIKQNIPHERQSSKSLTYIPGRWVPDRTPTVGLSREKYVSKKGYRPGVRVGNLNTCVAAKNGKVAFKR